MSHVEQSVQLCELYSKKAFDSVNEIQKNQFLESSFKKRLGSLSHISKRRFNFLSRIRKKFNSLSRITKRFNSLSHFLKKKCKKKVQFCESYY